MWPVTQGTVSGLGCQRGSTLLEALGRGGRAAVPTQTALLANWVTQDLPTRLDMLWQAPASSPPLTPPQQALVGPTASSSHVYLQVGYKSSRHLALATS